MIVFDDAIQRYRVKYEFVPKMVRFVVVDQSAEWSILTPEVCSSNPVIGEFGKNICLPSLHWKDKNKEKEVRNGAFFKNVRFARRRTDEIYSASMSWKLFSKNWSFKDQTTPTTTIEIFFKDVSIFAINFLKKKKLFLFCFRWNFLMKYSRGHFLSKLWQKANFKDYKNMLSH